MLFFSLRSLLRSRCGFARLLAAVSTLAAATPIVSAAFNPLQDALGFNAFVLDNMALGDGHVEGATAVGGNILFDGTANYGMTKAGTYKVNPGDGAATSLAVRGQFVWSGSLKIGTHTIEAKTSDTKLNNGWIAVGNANSTKFWGTSGAQAWTSSSTSNNFRLTASTSNSRDSSPRLEASVTQAPTTVARGPGIDFETQFALLQTKSNYLATLVDSRVATFDGTNLNLSLKANQLNVVNLTAAQFQSIANMNVNNAGTLLNSKTGLLFNVTGTTVKFGPFNPLSPSLGSYILYNFATATELTMVDRSITGSILAPQANFSRNSYDSSGALLSTSSSNVDGQIIAKSFLQTSGGETHSVLLDMTVVPEPATWAALLGALSLGFVVWRRRSTRR